MRKALILLLVFTLLHADFLIERVDVTISDIKDDGSAKVHESIKFIMYGDYSASLYDSGISSNELVFWSTNIGLKDVKFHVNPAKVDIRDFRLRPQPRTKCNPIQGVCHGELILDYMAYPSYINATDAIEPDTGLFTVEKYKPRTLRYTVNPASLSFTTTPEGNIILDDVVYLTIKLPADSVLLDANPQPSEGLTLPAHVDTLSWSDSVLVKFSLIFDVEEGIDKEVSDFFGSIIRTVNDTLSSPHGIAVVALIIILIGSYAYILMSRRRGED
ncbi:hypothetical protein H0O00_01805 [Candidatus Micrarchaeota archaeon]|nr:hypothetical protein [Candidatus Micrarchaeota archaeon]